MAYEIKYRSDNEMKDSGIEWLGKIPKEWEVNKNKYNFYEIKKLSIDGSELLLSVSEYYGVAPRQDKIDSTDFLTRADSLVGYKKCLPNDIVMNIMLAWKKSIGLSRWDGIVSPAYSVYRPLNRNISSYYTYLFRTDLYASYFKSHSTGIIDSRLRLYPEVFLALYSHQPSISDQQKIANFLDIKTSEFDSIISKKEQLIEKLEAAKKSLISEVVTGKVTIVDGKLVDRKPEEMKDSGVEWLGMIPKDWEIKRVKYIVDYIQTGGTPSTSNQEYFDGNINWFNPSDLNNEILYNSERKITRKAIKLNQAKLFFSESILIVGIGATAGKTSYLKVESSFNQQITGMHSKINNNKYIYYAIKNISLELLKLANFTTLPILNNEFIKNIKLCLPNLEEQQKVVEFLNLELIQMDSIITKTKQQISKLKEAKQSLISEAVTGKIDLRDWEIIETGGR